MRLVLPILLRLFVLLPCFSCKRSKFVSIQTVIENEPGYVMVIKFIEYGNVMDKVMDVINGNSLMITKMEQSYLSTDRQEIRIAIKEGDSKALNEAESQIRNVMHVESVSIIRL